MPKPIISHLDADLRDRLRHRAGQHGRSLEEEIVEILRGVLALDEPVEKVGLGSRISRRLADIGFDRDIEEFRGQYVEPARFDPK